MTFAEFSAKLLEHDAILPDPTLTVREVEDACVVDDWFPFPLSGVSSGYLDYSTHPVTDAGGSVLGELLTCKDEEYRLAEFSAQYLAAYLSDASAANYAQPGSFRQNYFVCPASRVNEYRQEYLSSSAVWGGFSHPTAGAVVLPIRSITAISAVRGMRLPTDMHTEAMLRSVIQPHAFERFLKLYHLLELSFDYLLVEQIRHLGTDLRGIGQLLGSYERAEIDRLKDVLSHSVATPSISECLRVLCRDHRWHQQIGTIFFEYGKSSNPLQSKRAKFEELLRSAEFTERDAIAYNLCDGSQDPAVRQANFAKLTLSVAAYWIYRLRCSIAHNKIGEYVMRLSDEPFVENFGEPLLRRVLAAVLV